MNQAKCSCSSPLFIIPIEPSYTFVPNSHLKKKKTKSSLFYSRSGCQFCKFLLAFSALSILSVGIFFFLAAQNRPAQSKSGSSTSTTTNTTTATSELVNSTETPLKAAAFAQLNMSELIKPLCPLVPPNLVGKLTINTTGLPLAELEAHLPEVQSGGHFRPPDCWPRHRVAIVVPYRDRAAHLLALLAHLHPVLMRQQLEYAIFVAEQAGDKPFNRGKVCNAGYLEALRHFRFDCVILHDVDLLPEDDRNLYSCPGAGQPRHMSVAVNTFDYKLPYDFIFGGVSALTREQFETVNGFPNSFWGWGGEDDDLFYRISHHNYSVSRYEAEIARYTMLEHPKATEVSGNWNKLNCKECFAKDGLNSIQYVLLNTTFHRLYTWILVDLGSP